MPKAVADPTRAPAAAQSAPAPNEEVLAIAARRERGELTPWDVACEMEEPIYDIQNYASALMLMAEGLPGHTSGAVGCIARSIIEAVEEVKERRERLFHDLHPHSHRSLDDGNGEVEPAAGDAGGAHDDD